MKLCSDAIGIRSQFPYQSIIPLTENSVEDLEDKKLDDVTIVNGKVVSSN